MRKLNYFLISILLTFILVGSAFPASTASTASGNWNNAAIWTNGVPGTNDVVTITAGHTVTVNVNTAAIRSLTIQTGAVLQGDGTGKSLIIGNAGGADFTNNGSLLARDAQALTVVLNRNSQWGGTGTFQLSALDLSARTLSFSLGSSFTVRLNASPDPILNPGRINSALDVAFAFDGPSPQNLPNDSNVHYRNLIIDNPAGVTVKTSLTTTNLNGSLTLTPGSLLTTVDGTSAFEISGNGANSVTLGANSTLRLGCTAATPSPFPGGFVTYNIDESSTVDYVNNSPATQVISLNPVYGNIQLHGTGPKLLANGTLSLIGNWTNDASGALSVTSPNTVIFGAAASSAKSIGGSSSTSFDNLTINNSSGISLNAAITVNGTLGLGSHQISTGANILALGPAGSVSRTTGYVNGYLQKQAPVGPANLTFEVGDASSYAPVDFAFSNVTSAGGLVVSSTAGEHPSIGSSFLDPPKDANRYWSVTSAGIGFTSYNVTLHFVGGDVDGGANTANFAVNKYDSPTWYTETTGLRTATSSQALGLASFCDFAVGELQTFTISASAGANGTLTPNGSVVVSYGSNQAFTVTPNTGYHVDSVLVDGVDVGPVGAYTFTSVTANHTIRSVYAIDQLTITATTGLNGSITPSGSVVVDYGSDQAFTITPNTGYYIADVQVDSVSVGQVTSYTFTNVTANHTIQATFAITQYTISASAGPNGSIAPSGTVVVDHGASQGFTITPNTGYHIDSVLVDGVDQGPVGSYTFTNVTANHAIRTVYAIDQFTITATADSNGTLSPDGSVAVNYGANQGFTITPNTGYYIAEVQVDSVSVGQVTSYTFTNVTSNHTIQATFAITQYTISASAGSNGSIAPSGAVLVDHGASQGFTITPNTGYYIADVQVDSVSVGQVTSYTFTNVTSNHTIQATFAITQYTVTAVAGWHGTLTPAGSTVANYGDSLAYTITPDNGYYIVGVQVDTVSVGAVTHYTFTNITANHLISAVFAALNHTPSATRLLLPASGDTLVIENLGPSVGFTWSASADSDVADALTYSIHLSGPGIDSVMAGLTDTTLQWGISSMLQSGGSYWWTVNVTDGQAVTASPDTFTFHVTSLVAVLDAGKDIPKTYGLFQNFPNPFNPTTVVQFDLPRASEVRITVYNLIGQEVAVLVDQTSMGAGHHEVSMDAGSMSSGVYLYRITAKGESGDIFSSVKKMVLVK